MKKFIVLLVGLMLLVSVNVSADSSRWTAGSIWFWSKNTTKDKSGHVEYGRSKILFDRHDDISVFSVSTNRGHYMEISTYIKDPRDTTWSRVEIVHVNAREGRQVAVDIKPEDVIFNRGSILRMDTSIATTHFRITVYPR